MIRFLASVLLSIIGSASADSHAAICATQFNYWFNVADNNGPKGYPIQSAKQKLMTMADAAGFGDVSVCEMQQNANAYYEFLKNELIKARNLPENEAIDKSIGFGFPFFQNKAFYGYLPTCESESEVGDLDMEAFGVPVAACAFAYPGTNLQDTDLGLPEEETMFDSGELCRLKLFGHDGVDKELQWCMPNILGTMTVDTVGGYTDQSGPPALVCTSDTSLGEKGNQVFPPLRRDHADFPTNMLDETPIVLGDDFIPLDPYQDPYQSFGVVFLSLANQLVDGLCNECDNCIEMAKTKFSKTVTDPEEFCVENDLCPKSHEKPKRLKKSKEEKSKKDKLSKQYYN